MGENFSIALVSWVTSQVPPAAQVPQAVDPTSMMAGLIYQYGGWGLSAILMTVIWRMAKYILQLHKEQRDQDREQYKQLIETLVSNKQALDSLSKALQEFLNRL